MRRAKEIRAEIKRLKDYDEQTWVQFMHGEVSQKNMEDAHREAFHKIKALEWVLNEEVQK